MGQMTIDGGEVEAPTAPRYIKPLTQVQRLILQHLTEHGIIRGVEAGLIVHRARERPCALYGAKAQDFRGGPQAIGCCAYCASDGLDALKRLGKRGLLVRRARGWVRAES